MSEFCLAHWERTKRRVPAFRLGLCGACFEGKGIFPAENLGETGKDGLCRTKNEYYKKNAKRIRKQARIRKAALQNMRRKAAPASKGQGARLSV